MIYLLIFIAGVFLAYSNGANDNFKGVATLFGSGTATKKANVKVISGILLLWVFTLPVAALISGAIFLLIKNI